MSASTYFQSILTAFSQMDIEKLHLLLNDDYSYQDTTKEIFLEKIKEIFDTHRNSGDTELRYYKGKCNSNECENCGTGGYRFVGNSSKNYLDLLFVQQGDDVKDIFNCGNFKSDEETGDLNNSDYISINRDDEVTFEKTPSYWLNLNDALKAYNQIITAPQQTFTLDEISYWLKRNWYTAEKIGPHDIFTGSMRWTPFVNLYAALKELSNFIEVYQHQIVEAAGEIKNLNDEPAIIEWLLKYEDMYHNIPYELKYGDWGWVASDWGKLTIFEIVTAPTVKALVDFLSYCNDKHTAMITKYSIYTPEEDSEIFNSPEYQKGDNFLYSLHHHLTKREEARELGMDIPLFINERKGETPEQGEMVSGDTTPF